VARHTIERERDKADGSDDNNVFMKNMVFGQRTGFSRTTTHS